jgi:excinuclease UvrABC nuclease subunit
VSEKFDWTLQANNVSPNDLRALCSPGVYLFWRKKVQADYFWDRESKDTRGEVALYIGSSRRTITRISNPKHEKAQLALEQATRIELRFCKTEAFARQLEAELIAEYQPLYNVIHKKNGSK